MDIPTKEERRLAMLRLFEHMVEAGWLSRLVATHDTARTRLTKDGECTLR